MFEPFAKMTMQEKLALVRKHNIQHFHEWNFEGKLRVGGPLCFEPSRRSVSRTFLG